MTGGEPLLRDDLEEILAHARSIGLRTVLNTKGIGLAGRPDLLASHRRAGAQPRHARSGFAGGSDRPAARGRRGDPRDARLRACGVPPHGNQDSCWPPWRRRTTWRKSPRFSISPCDNALGFQVSPEIVGTNVNPLLRDNDRYRALIDRVLADETIPRGVLGVPSICSASATSAASAVIRC